jgi:2-polyprenyl-3-methyl-5-hydroxy-6-metoxy-1,4-benzoquinol methylase
MYIFIVTHAHNDKFIHTYAHIFLSSGQACASKMCACIDAQTYIYMHKHTNTYVHTYVCQRSVLGGVDMRGKTVIELGCGTGLVSILCAKMGARVVVATGEICICQHTCLNVCVYVCSGTG